MYSFFRDEASDYMGLNWLENETIKGTIWGISPISSKSFLAWGSFDTIDKTYIPGIGYYDGMQWSRLRDSSTGSITSGAWFGDTAFFAVSTDSMSSSIFSNILGDVIIAHYSPYSTAYNTLTFNVETGPVTITNDSGSNRDLVFHYIWSMGGNCTCWSGCDFSGSLSPGQSASLWSNIEPEELSPWSWLGVEIDNSTNQYDPMGVSGNSNFNSVTSHSKPTEQITVSQVAHGIMVTTPEDSPESARVQFFNEIGQCVKNAKTSSSNPTFISFDSQRGLIFVRIETANITSIHNFVF